MFIPKKLWKRAEDRFLSFREIVCSEIGSFSDTEKYEKLGSDVMENTPEEISGLASEMEARLKGSWNPSDDDERLQSLFWSFYEHLPQWKSVMPRVGADFLRRNVQLLDRQ